AVAISLLQVEFRWAGSINPISYTYIPTDGTGFIYAFGFMGLVMLGLGCVEAYRFVFTPVMEQSRVLNRDRHTFMQDV
ncbi:unnamed protein product, partial [marine sediment metagenome]